MGGNYMEITMLGTGNALVTECYNTCFVLHEGAESFLVDGGGGNGVLSQLKRADLDWKNMRTIFVTHKHIDHILGIVWMVRMICQNMSQGKYEGEAVIYGMMKPLPWSKTWLKNCFRKNRLSSSETACA